MADLLSQLCSICHKNPPKYRCPACSTQTCSLECVQRHKGWGCSGKRDPTAYVKKSQLVSASGVDHDYNFLVGIEQSRDRAEERVHGLNDAKGRSAKLNHDGFRHRLRQTGVNVDYAPIGMTRQKLNQTRLSKSKRINWTIEWLHSDGTSAIAFILDDVELSTQYKALYLKHTGLPGKKRKRDDEPSAAPSSGPGPLQGDGATTATENEPRDDSIPKPLVQDLKEEPSPSQTEVKPEEGTSSSSHVKGDIEDRQSDAVKSDAPAIVTSESEDQATTAAPNPGSPDDFGSYYYLLKPRTSGSDKVLIPLSATTTLFDCLRNQVILEFPTIQVLDVPASRLPEGFVTEKQYLERFNKERLEMSQLLQAEDGEIVDAPTAAGNASAEPVIDTGIPNPSALIQTLERDLRG